MEPEIFKVVNDTNNSKEKYNLKDKILISAVIVSVILLVLTVWNSIPKHYNETLNGVYYQLGNEDVSENIKVHMDGKLSPRFFGNKKFKGTVKFEGERVPSPPKDRSELEFYYWSESGWGVINSYFRMDEDGVANADIYQYGYLYINDDFTQFTIKVDTEESEESWSIHNGFMITAPASNRDEALEISTKLIKDYEDSFTND